MRNFFRNMGLFRRDLDADASARKLRTWFLLARVALAVCAVVDLVRTRQAPLADLFALAAALPLERWRLPGHWFALPAAALAARAIHSTGVEQAPAFVLGVFALSGVVFLLGTLVRDLRWIG